MNWGPVREVRAPWWMRLFGWRLLHVPVSTTDDQDRRAREVLKRYTGVADAEFVAWHRSEWDSDMTVHSFRVKGPLPCEREPQKYAITNKAQAIFAWLEDDR